jgi:hypothetical protein
VPEQKKQSRFLENLITLLFGTIPKWSVDAIVRTINEELDLVIRNEQDDDFWSRRGNFILFECKNWIGGRLPGRGEVDRFLRKIERLGPDYCRLGIFVSMEGVSQGFEQEASRLVGKGPVISVMDRQGIWELICAPDRGDWLKQLVQERVFG